MQIILIQTNLLKQIGMQLLTICNCGAKVQHLQYHLKDPLFREYKKRVKTTNC